MPFQTDLTFGQVWEARSIKELSKTNDVVVQAPNRTYPYWDFKINDIKFESKADKYETGNMMIEYSSRGKDSGIRTTTSDYYIYWFVTNERYYVIPTPVIKQMIKKKNYVKRLRGGDNNTSKMYMFKERQFSKYLVKGNPNKCLFEISDSD